MSRSAYYSRNDSYSRSYNAECAEDEERFPRTRAAAYLGMTVKAFDAACRAAGYVASEWHHVGKYANKVDYYDTIELRQSDAFWMAALAASSATKQQEISARRAEFTRQEQIAQYRATLANWKSFALKIKNQLNCTPRFASRATSANWQKHCLRVGCPNAMLPKVGDHAALIQAVAEFAAYRDLMASLWIDLPAEAREVPGFRFFNNVYTGDSDVAEIVRRRTKRGDSIRLVRRAGDRVCRIDPHVSIFICEAK